MMSKVFGRTTHDTDCCGKGKSESVIVSRTAVSISAMLGTDGCVGDRSVAGVIDWAGGWTLGKHVTPGGLIAVPATTVSRIAGCG